MLWALLQSIHSLFAPREHAQAAPWIGLLKRRLNTSRWLVDVISRVRIQGLDRSTCGGKEYGTFLPSVRAVVKKKKRVWLIKKSCCCCSSVLDIYWGEVLKPRKSIFIPPFFIHENIFLCHQGIGRAQLSIETVNWNMRCPLSENLLMKE